MSKKGEYGIALNCTYVVLSMAVVTILALLVLYLPNMRQIDMDILHTTRKFLTQYPTHIASFVTTFGYANNLLWPQITAGSVLVSHRRYLTCFLLIFFTQASFVILNMMKNSVCRERPCIYQGFSFPSSHATVTMCFYGILIYLVNRHVSSQFWRYFLITVFGIFIFLVALSRLWLGVHFLTDVIAGLFLGFMMVNLFIIVSKLLGR